jgi:hypothetical protein
MENKEALELLDTTVEGGAFCLEYPQAYITIRSLLEQPEAINQEALWNSIDVLRDCSYYDGFNHGRNCGPDNQKNNVIERPSISQIKEAHKTIRAASKRVSDPYKLPEADPESILEKLYTEMDQAFKLGKHHNNGLCNDDTQIGIEWAFKWLSEKGYLRTATEQPNNPESLCPKPESLDPSRGVEGSGYAQPSSMSLHAAPADAQDGGVLLPEGYALVPIEPTEKTITAGMLCDHKTDDARDYLKHQFMAMIAAAQGEK